MSRLTLTLASKEQLRMAYHIMRDFHDSVSQFSGEMSSPSIERFMEYWCPSQQRMIFLLCDGLDAVGVALIQELSEPQYIELGAIYIKPNYRRGFNAYKLYSACAAVARERKLPLKSETSMQNKRSISLALIMAKRYKRSFLGSDFNLSSTDLNRVAVSLTHEKHT